MATRVGFRCTRNRLIRTGALGMVVGLAIGCGGNTVSSGAPSGAFAVVGLNVPSAPGKPMVGTMSADGTTFAASVPFSGNWYVWNQNSGWRDTNIVSGVTVTGAPRLSSNGKSLLINTASGPYLYSNGSSGHLPPYGLETTPTAFAFSADGHRILGSTTYQGYGPESGTLIEWTDTASPDAIPGAVPFGDGSIGYITATGFAVDGATPIGYTNIWTLGTGPNGGLPYLQYSSTLYWSIQNGSETNTGSVQGPPSAVSPNGRTFAGTAYSAGVVWDATGSVSHKFAITASSNVDVLAVAVSDAGTVVAGHFIAHDGTVTPWIWDSVHGERLAMDVINANGLAARLVGYTLKSVLGLSANGKTILFQAGNSSGADSLALVHLAGG
jgi:hypothetical protein